MKITRWDSSLDSHERDNIDYSFKGFRRRKDRGTNSSSTKPIGRSQDELLSQGIRSLKPPASPLHSTRGSKLRVRPSSVDNTAPLFTSSSFNSSSATSTLKHSSSSFSGSGRSAGAKLALPPSSSGEDNHTRSYSFVKSSIASLSPLAEVQETADSHLKTENVNESSPGRSEHETWGRHGATDDEKENISNHESSDDQLYILPSSLTMPSMTTTTSARRISFNNIGVKEKLNPLNSIHPRPPTPFGQRTYRSEGEIHHSSSSSFQKMNKNRPPTPIIPSREILSKNHNSFTKSSKIQNRPPTPIPRDLRSSTFRSLSRSTIGSPTQSSVSATVSAINKRKQESEEKMRSILANIVQREQQHTTEYQQQSEKPFTTNGRSSHFNTSSEGQQQTYEPLKSAKFELKTSTNSNHVRSPSNRNSQDYYHQFNESLQEKIAKKDKLIREQMKIIRGLLDHVETLSKLSGSDTNDKNNRRSGSARIITGDEKEEDDVAAEANSFLLSFDDLFAKSGKISPLTIEKGLSCDIESSEITDDQDMATCCRLL